MNHREAVDGMKAVPPNRRFIIGVVRFTHPSRGFSASGGPTRYFADLDILERLLQRRPHIVKLVVCKRLDVVGEDGKKCFP